MNLLNIKRKYNGLAMKLNKTKEDQKEMDRLEKLIIENNQKHFVTEAEKIYRRLDKMRCENEK